MSTMISRTRNLDTSRGYSVAGLLVFDSANLANCPPGSKASSFPAVVFPEPDTPISNMTDRSPRYNPPP
jgi:hypothetical protein